MQETKFIEQNKQKWSEFEKILDQKKKDPDKLSELFIEITDDLSYSRTFYPNRSVSVYLNNLAQKIFPTIYKNKKLRGSRFLNLWTDEIPSMIWYARKQFILSFAIFIISMLIGVVSTANDPTFTTTIMGSDYMGMTIDNIEKGDPMAVYKSMGQADMFFAITYNNLIVAFYTFVMGVFFSLGSGIFLVINGVMLGTFQYFFYQQGLFQESFLTIWQHGTIEISCIIIAGAAGITLGQGLVFPGSYSRVQAFQQSARRGITIMLGITPLIIMAGFIESFITRYTEVHDGIRLASILISLLFILFYFVWLPYKKSRDGSLSKVKAAKLPPTIDYIIDTQKIKTNGEIFIDTFHVLKKMFSKFILGALFIAIGYILFIRYAMPENYIYQFRPFRAEDSIFTYLFQALPYLRKFFLYEMYYELLIINLGIIFLLTFSIHFYLKKVTEQNTFKPVFTAKEVIGSLGRSFINIILVSLLLNLIVFYSHALIWILFLFVLPYFIMVKFISYKEKINFMTATSRMFTLIKGTGAKLLGLYSVIFLLGFGYFVIVCSPLLRFIYDFILQNMTINFSDKHMIFVIYTAFFIVLGFVLIYTLLLISSGILYYSLKEINEANDLKVKIAEMGMKKKNGK